jgi:predicted oxidoreductase (fatty acid repression mutant protein)
MRRTFEQALTHRRTYYSIGNDSSIMDEEVIHILRAAVKYVPSAFNSQSARVVLLLGDEHRKFWNIVKETLRKRISSEAFVHTEEKINKSFMGGHGTVLFYEETDIVKGLQEKFPSYKENFPVWSEQASAMHQLAVWTMLEDAGMGASLQHYNPIIDDEVRATWNLPEHWKLIAQMPFGIPLAEPGEKQYDDVSARIKVFGNG